MKEQWLAVKEQPVALRLPRGGPGQASVPILGNSGEDTDRSLAVKVDKAGAATQRCQPPRPAGGLVISDVQHPDAHEAKEEAKKSGTFELSSPEKEEKASEQPVSLGSLAVADPERPPRSVREATQILEEEASVAGLQTVVDETEEDKDDNETAKATDGDGLHDVWLREPQLILLRSELEQISNPKIADYKPNQQLHDWFNTRLYRRVHDEHIVQFNHDLEPTLFNSPSEIVETLNDLHNRNIGAEGQEHYERAGLLPSFIKGVCTLREILKKELGMQRLYEKYIYLYGQEIDLENTSKLLLRCKLLLQGRKVLSQTLLVIVERNKLVTSLKQMIALAEEQSAASSGCSQVGDGDLGDFKFDEVLAKELGETITHYTLVIQALIKDLKAQHTFPGLRCNSIKSNSSEPNSDKVFVFKGTDYVRYIRKETNEIKHLLFAYKIEV